MAEEAAEVVDDTFDADMDAMRDNDLPEGAPDIGDGATDAAPAAAETPAEDAAETAIKRELRAMKAALREERTRRQAVEAKQQQATPSATFQAMLDGAPDENADPIGFMSHMRQKLAAIDAQHEADARAEAARNQQNGQIQHVVRTMQEYENDFRADHPDYGPAVEHFRKTRADEIAAQGLTGQALDNAIGQDFLALAARCLNAGKDPAEVVYNLAKRSGYKPQGKVSSVDPQTERLNQIAKGQQQARSLSTGGAPPTGALTVEAVNKLDGAAFDAAFEKLRNQERRRA